MTGVQLADGSGPGRRQPAHLPAGPDSSRPGGTGLVHRDVAAGGGSDRHSGRTVRGDVGRGPAAGQDRNAAPGHRPGRLRRSSGRADRCRSPIVVNLDGSDLVSAADRRLQRELGEIMVRYPEVPPESEVGPGAAPVSASTGCVGWSGGRSVEGARLGHDGSAWSSRCSRSARCCSRPSSCRSTCSSRGTARMARALPGRRRRVRRRPDRAGERGRGGDTRTDVGTVARIMEVAELPDGRFLLATVRPAAHPSRALAGRRPVPAGRDRRVPPAARRAGCRRGLRRGDGASSAGCWPCWPSWGSRSPRPPSSWPTIRACGSFQAAAVAPLGPLDKQRLLSIPTADERLRVLLGLLADEAEVLEQRLRLG